MHTIANGRRSFVAGAIGRRCACWVLRFAATAVFLAAASLEIAHADQWAEKSEGQSADYVDAIMGHVRLRIPRDHLFFGVTRPGENWLDPNSKSTAKDPREIESFDLLLWPDLRPIRRGLDRDEWHRATTVVRPGGATREIVVRVERMNEGALTDEAGRARQQLTFRRMTERRALAKTILPEMGLIKWSESNPVALTQLWSGDVYHDEEFSTIIGCEEIGKNAPNPFQACRQVIVIGDLGLRISARYTLAHLPHWTGVNQRLESLVRSFVVEVRL